MRDNQMNSNIKVLQPLGILDSVSANNLRKEINEIVEKGATIVLVDFEKVSFINSSGLGALVAALKFVRSAGGELFICSLTEQVKMMVELTKMDRVFKTFTNREQFYQEVLGENNFVKKK
jgi:anti-sigma B factor antagonist